MLAFSGLILDAITDYNVLAVIMYCNTHIMLHDIPSASWVKNIKFLYVSPDLLHADIRVQY